MPFSSLILNASTAANADFLITEGTYLQCAGQCAKKNLVQPNKTTREFSPKRKEFQQCAKKCDSIFIDNITDRATKHAMRLIARDTKGFFIQQNSESLRLYFDAQANNVVPQF